MGMDRHRSFLRVGLVVLAAAALVIQALPAQAGIARGSFAQTNLVSDVPGLAPLKDDNLVNPWGLSSRGTSPIWVSDNGTSVSTLYTGAGGKVNVTVHIPAPDGTLTGTPTGTVSNITSDFVVPSPTGPAPSRFLFATEDGTVLGWAGGSNATIKVDNSGEHGAVYKGLTNGSVTNGSGTSNFLYAANFRSATVDVFDGQFHQVTLPGAFTDASLPAHFAPFGIQNIGDFISLFFAAGIDGEQHGLFGKIQNVDS